MPTEQDSSLPSDNVNPRIIFYRRKAQSIFKQAQTVDQMLNDFPINSFDEADLNVRLEAIDEICTAFNIAHDALEKLDFNEIESQLRIDFNDLITSLRSRMRREINRQTQMLPSSTLRHDQYSEGPTIIMQSRPRLPEIRLPTFSGSYTDYTNFFSMFSSLIDKDAELTGVEKLQHLRSSLNGAALDTIRALEIKESNYAVALDLLEKRFNNKRLIFQAHIAEILGLQRVDNPSAVKLRELSDKVNVNLCALKTIGNENQIAASIIIHTLLQKVDRATQANWEETAPVDTIPSCEQFTTFLDKRCQKLENIEHSLARISQVGKNSNTPNPSKKSFVGTNAFAGCVFCDSTDHIIYTCNHFKNLSPPLRLKESKRLALCLNCLRRGHQLKSCKAGFCRSCGAKHHSLLHIDNVNWQELASAEQNAQSSSPTTELLPQRSLAAIVPSSVTSKPSQNLSPDVVLLATAIVNVKNKAGKWVPCRALLDSGSQLHIITSRFAHQLQLRKTKSAISVSGLGDSKFVSNGYTININLRSQTSDYSTSFLALVAPSITDKQPNTTLNIASWKIPSNIRLADPDFNKSRHIDMLIGANLFYELLCLGQIKLEPGRPLLQKTRLGWVVAGTDSQSRTASVLAASASSTTERNYSQLDKLVRQFWELESCSSSIIKFTKEELDCEAHFKANFVRLSNGGYSVHLPVKTNINMLGDSYHQAFRRFLHLERKLERQPQSKKQHAAFMNEYLTLGHMSLVSLDNQHRCKYFLPHHCVMKEDSTTTKLRVVFDGSAASSSGYSLNDVLMTGPTIQPKLFNILLRFRTFSIALTGDICKMYRCVKVSEPDSSLQCILWRDTPQQEVQVFRLDTVTYGTRPASFLAVRSMHQLAFDEQLSFPLGSDILRRDFYVDDLITGGSSIQEVREIMDQVTNLLGKGQFKLRKWCSNNSDLLQDIPAEDTETLLKFDDGSDITKALGLTWDPASDRLLFAFSPVSGSARHCKRSVLSTIARFYDPLGLIGPIICKAKIFLQQLWREKLDWDEGLPLSLDTSWNSLCAELGRIPKLSFPRLSILPNGVIEVHGFSDASMDAYGACIYVVSGNEGERQVHLLCSKSRVSPLKTLTVPKLELCGAALLGQLINAVAKMKLFACPFYCWSDSAVALSWIHDEPSRFQVFTGNRITAIQEWTAGMDWHYVPTKLNPADILSRGAFPTELLESSLWIHGPEFLTKTQSEWPMPCSTIKSLPELRKSALLAVPQCTDISLKCKFINSWANIERVFAYIYKFRHHIRHPGLTVEHIRQGRKLLLRTIQKTHLSVDYNSLQAGLNVKPSSCIASLAPFIDDNGLLRVGGRLKNSALDFDAQHPVILPRRHPVTHAIIIHFHRRNLHAGPRALLANIRLKYWPIGGRKTVSSVINKCIICFRTKPQLAEHIMADLPEDRVNASYPFRVTGVDYCGPFLYKNEVRSRPPVKCYICIFICFATKAVHMELVTDLSTNSFLNALKRFILTRSQPARIWSDNATNFVGAKNELAELRALFLNDNHMKAVHEFCLDKAIEWRFIPPRSPHFGGLWEAAVKTAKYHFYRAVASSVLTFDGLRTLVCHIAAIINSRPLLPLSENPDDLDVLTPAHFIGTAPLSLFYEPDVTNIDINRLDRWQRVSYYQQIFWDRWRKEYLTLLQQRSKWRQQQPGLCVNDIVLVKNENLPPLKWPLGRIIKLSCGSDGVSRVAELKTATGVIERAVRKICPLPKQDEVEGRSPSTGGVCLVIHPNV